MQKGLKILTNFSLTFHHVNIWALSINFYIYTPYKPNISIYTSHHKKNGHLTGMGSRPAHPTHMPRADPKQYGSDTFVTREFTSWNNKIEFLLHGRGPIYAQSIV